MVVVKEFKNGRWEWKLPFVDKHQGHDWQIIFILFYSLIPDNADNDDEGIEHDSEDLEDDHTKELDHVLDVSTFTFFYFTNDGGKKIGSNDTWEMIEIHSSGRVHNNRRRNKK